THRSRGLGGAAVQDILSQGGSRKPRSWRPWGAAAVALAVAAVVIVQQTAGHRQARGQPGRAGSPTPARPRPPAGPARQPGGPTRIGGPRPALGSPPRSAGRREAASLVLAGEGRDEADRRPAAPAVRLPVHPRDRWLGGAG